MLSRESKCSKRCLCFCILQGADEYAAEDKHLGGVVGGGTAALGAPTSPPVLLEESFIWDPGHFPHRALLVPSDHHSHSHVGPGAGFIGQIGRAFG